MRRGTERDSAIAYRIEKDDHDVVDALRRIAAEEVEGALAAAEGDGDPAERVHDIRKRMKKLRGLLRLVQPAFPDYEEENAHFRDIARSISGARDAEVVAATLDRLLETHQEALELAAFRELQGELKGERSEAPDFEPAIAALRDALGRIDLWTLHETGWDAVADGLRKVYQSARKGRKAKDDEDLHAWRKSVKYHWHHVQLLCRIEPEAMDARQETADAVGACLGLRQDLAVLERRVKQSALSKASRRVLRGLIERRKAEILDEARTLAPRLFADKPKALVSRWGEAWEEWRK